MTGARLSGLFVYPLKSARGVSCDSAVVEERGLKHDRRWMLVDQDGGFVTQRNEPKMATLVVGLPDGLLAGDGSIVLKTDGFTDLLVPIPDKDTSRLPATVWRDRVDAQVACGEANAWVSEFLGRTTWLVYMPDDARRPTGLDASTNVSFADGYPYLLCNTASLSDLNSRLKDPIPMDRFRTNLVVEGLEAWAEDDLHRFRIGDVEFEMIRPCERCVITTTDQTSGTRRGPEPLHELAKFRNGPEGRMLFGTNLVARDTGPLDLGARLSPIA